LLYFEEHQSAANRMDRAGLQEEAVADGRGHGVEEVFDRPGSDRLPQGFGRDDRQQAGEYARRRVGFEDDPRLRLADGRRPFELLSSRIVRMHLNRERLASVEELQQEREPTLRGFRTADDSFRHAIHELAERPTCERPVGHDARLVRAIGE
jgi:hypothetical protein